MSTSRVLDRLRPLSYGIAVAVTAITALAVLIAAIWSLLSHTAELGISVAIMMFIYAAIIAAIAVAAWLRQSWAWGMMVAVSLLNAFTAGSFIRTDHGFQFWLAVVWLLMSIAGGVAAILPSTRMAMRPR